MKVIEKTFKETNNRSFYSANQWLAYQFVLVRLIHPGLLPVAAIRRFKSEGGYVLEVDIKQV